MVASGYGPGVSLRQLKWTLLRDELLATNERCLALQAELLASAVDTGLLAALAQPTLIGQRRIPGLKLHDDRVIRLLETLLHPGGFVANWTTRELQARILARHQLVQTAYRLSQLRYDPAKLRAVLPDQVRLSHSVSGQDQKATGAVNIVTLHGILT